MSTDLKLYIDLDEQASRWPLWGKTCYSDMKDL